MIYEFRFKDILTVLLFITITAVTSASLFINSFNSGVLDKDLKVRQDLEKTLMGSEKLENILVRPHGMAYRRPGTEFIADANDANYVEAVPPWQIRNEKYFVTGRLNFYWFDPNDELLTYEAIENSAQGNTCDVDEDGNIVAGSGPNDEGCYIYLWDSDRNRTDDFFQPSDNWGTGINLYQYIDTIKYNQDGSAVYCVGVCVSASPRFYRFDATTGADDWTYSRQYANVGVFYIDAEDNLYYTRGVLGATAMTIEKVNSSGSMVSADTVTLSQYVDLISVYLDEDNDRFYCYGQNYDFAGNNDYDGAALLALDSDGENLNYFQRNNGGGEWDTELIYKVIKKDEYIYAVGSRGAHGIGGSQATVFKLDSSLNLIASYDTGANTEAWDIRLDRDENIYIEYAVETPSGHFYIITIDDDLSSATAVLDNSFEHGQYGNEFLVLDYMGVGSPGYWAKYPSYKTTGSIRLIPFEYSTNDAYVLEFGHEYIGFLRTVP